MEEKKDQLKNQFPIFPHVIKLCRMVSGYSQNINGVSWSTRVTPAFRSFDVERPKSLANGREYTECIGS